MRGKRALKTTGLVLAGLVVLSIAALAFFLTDPGESLIKRRAVRAINESIAGQIAVGELELSLGFRGARIALADVVVRNPEGGEVAHVQGLSARLDVSRLLTGELVAHQVRVERPRLRLRRGPHGLDLARALRPTQPRAERRARWDAVRVQELTVRDGEIHYAEAAPSPPRFAAVDVDLDGHGRFETDTGSFAGRLRGQGDVRAPVKGPLDFEVTAEGTAADWQGALTLALADSKLRARVQQGGARAEAVAPPFDLAAGTLPQRVPLGVLVQTLHATPELLRAFWPAYPLTTALRTQGQLARFAPQGFWANLALSAGDQKLHVKGAVDLAARRARGLDVTGENIDLSRLNPRWPQSRLSLAGKLDATGDTWDNLRGRLSLQVERGRLAGRSAGPVTIEASATRHRYRLSRFEANVPGARLTAQGGGRKSRLDVSGRLQVSDFRRLRGVLLPFGVDVPPLRGRGRISFTLHGTPQRPALRLRGRIPYLQQGDRVLRGLQLRLDLDDVRDLDGQIELSANRLQLDDTSIGYLSIKATGSRDHPLRVRARAGEPLRLTVRAVGDLQRAQQRARLRHLVIRYPDERWRMAGATWVSWADGGLTMRDLVMRADAQRLALSAVKTQQGWKATAELRDIRLQELPRGLRRGWPRLAGQMSGQVTFTGTPQDPTLVAELALVNGRLLRLGRITVTLDLSYAEERATGSLFVRVPGAVSQSRFDVRLRQPLPDENPIALHGQLTVAQLSALTAWLRRADMLPGTDRGDALARLTGSAALSFAIDGQVTAPRARLRLRSDDLRVLPALTGLRAREQPAVIDTLVALLTYRDQRVALQLAFDTAPAGHVSAQAQVKVDLGALLTGQAPRKVGERLPVRGRVRLTDVPVAVLPAGLFPRVRGLRGSVDGELALGGRLREPTLAGKLVWSQGRIIVPQRKPQARRRAIPSLARRPPSR